MEQVSLACSLYLLNERTRSDAELRMRGSVLEEILSHRISIQEISNRAEHIGFDLKSPYLTVILDQYSIKGKEEEGYQLTDKLIESISIFFKERGIHVLLGQKLGCVVILLSESILEEKNYTIEMICKEMGDFCHHWNPPYQYKLGISSTSDSIQDAPNLYEESLAALKVANRKRNIIFFD